MGQDKTILQASAHLLAPTDAPELALAPHRRLPPGPAVDGGLSVGGVVSSPRSPRPPTPPRPPRPLPSLTASIPVILIILVILVTATVTVIVAVLPTVLFIVRTASCHQRWTSASSRPTPQVQGYGASSRCSRHCRRRATTHRPPEVHCDLRCRHSSGRCCPNPSSRCCPAPPPRRGRARRALVHRGRRHGPGGNGSHDRRQCCDQRGVGHEAGRGLIVGETEDGRVTGHHEGGGPFALGLHNCTC